MVFYTYTHITSQHGKTALIIAVQNGDEDVVKVLLNAKADLRLQDEVIVLPQSPDNKPQHFTRYFESKVGRDLYSNILLVSTIRPHKRVDTVESHDDLAIDIQRNSSNVGHAPIFPSLLVLPTEDWQ